MVQKWGLFSFKDSRHSMRKGGVHLPALSKEAIPTRSAGEAVATWGGPEKHCEEITPCVFSHGLQAEKACEWTLAIYPLPPWLIVHQTSSNTCPALLCIQVWSLCQPGEPAFYGCAGECEGSVFKGCSCERALIKAESPAEQTGWSLAAKRANHWAETSLSIAEVANGSVSHLSWQLGIFSLSIHVQSKVKPWQGTATNQSWVFGEGMLNTPSQCNKPLWAR